MRVGWRQVATRVQMRGARCRAARSGSGWSRSGTARRAATSAPRTGQALSMRPTESPEAGPRRPGGSRGSGSSAVAARAGRGRSARGTRSRRRRGRGRSCRWARPTYPSYGLDTGPGRNSSANCLAPAVSEHPSGRLTHRRSDDSKTEMGDGADVDRIADGGARRDGRVDRAELDPAAPARVRRRARMDGQRVRTELRGAADDGRRAGRPVRAPAAVRRAGWLLFVAASAACALPTDVGCADRGARGAGRRRGGDRAAVAGAAERARSRRSAAAWALGMFGAITGSRSSPVRWWAAQSPRPRTGSGSSGSTSRSGWPRSHLFWARIEESFGPRAGLDAPGLILVTVAALGIVWGLVRGNGAGWGSVEVVATLALGVVAVDGVRAVGAARARADAADAAVPLPGVRSGQRGNAADVRGAVQRRVLHGPVPADDPGAVAAAGRGAADPLDRRRS